MLASVGAANRDAGRQEPEVEKTPEPESLARHTWFGDVTGPTFTCPHFFIGDIAFQSDAVQKVAEEIEHVVEETEREAESNECKQDVAKETAPEQTMEEAIKGEHIEFKLNVTEQNTSELTVVGDVGQVGEETEQVGAVTQVSRCCAVSFH